MKKILLAVTAALAITSCSQNEEFENAGQKAEINFGSIVSNSTRATITDDGNFDTFTVNGYKTSSIMGSEVTLTSGFINNEVVNKTEGVWKHDKVFYWPINYVQFFATSPQQTLTVPGAGYPEFSYTVGAIDTQKDLLVANLKDQQKSDAAVQLTFQHALTQVNFSIKGDTKGFDYKVTKLIIKGVDGTGLFKFDGTDNVGGWTPDAKAAGIYETSYVEGSEIALTDVADDLSTVVKFDVDPKKSLFMLLPQTLQAGAEVAITYTAAPTGKTDATDLTFTGTKKVALTGTWAASKKVRYTLTLTSDAKEITIGDPSVSGWGEPETNTPLTPSN